MKMFEKKENCILLLAFINQMFIAFLPLSLFLKLIMIWIFGLIWVLIWFKEYKKIRNKSI